MEKVVVFLVSNVIECRWIDAKESGNLIWDSRRLLQQSSVGFDGFVDWLSISGERESVVGLRFFPHDVEAFSRLSAVIAINPLVRSTDQFVDILFRVIELRIKSGGEQSFEYNKLFIGNCCFAIATAVEDLGISELGNLHFGLKEAVVCWDEND